MLDCPQAATTPAWRVERAFGRMLMAYRLGEGWQDDLRALEEVSSDDLEFDFSAKRKVLLDEQEAYNLMFVSKGIDQSRYQRETARIQAALAALEQGTSRDVQRQSELAAGETLVALPELWEAARDHEDVEAMREFAVSLLQPKGLIWDGELRAIVAIVPHGEYAPSLRLALRNWQWDDGQFVVPEPEPERSKQIRVIQKKRVVRDKRVRTKIRREQPPSRYRLTPVQQQEVRKLLAEGLSIRDVAKRFEVSHSAIWRVAHRQEEG